ncbi:hypothetical protein, partial [Nitrospirillum viridazoti]
MMDIDLGALLTQDSAAVYLVGASLLLSVAALVLSSALLLRWSRNRHAPVAEAAIPTYEETRRQVLAEGDRAPSPVVGARDAHAAAQR